MPKAAYDIRRQLLLFMAPLLFTDLHGTSEKALGTFRGEKYVARNVSDLEIETDG